tara:strand:- start:3125 stop:3961 length:837 start_codon:yes stop_codon:yes gene_type:complete
MSVAFIIVVIIVILVCAFLYWRYKKNNLNKYAKKQLWANEKKSTAKMHVEEDIETSVNGPNVSVTYAMTLNISKWIYSKSRKLPGTYRELLTHGNGFYGKMEDNDIISIAFEPFRNDLHIAINTIVSKQDTFKSKCDTEETEIEDEPEIYVGNDGKKRRVEIVTLKYFPLASDFHIAIVLTNNRIDAYLNGRLNVTKVLHGRILAGYTGPSGTLPLKFFQGAPIKGFINNFNYFNQDMPISKIKEIYTMSKMPTKITDVVSDAHDIYEVLDACQEPTK